MKKMTLVVVLALMIVGCSAGNQAAAITIEPEPILLESETDQNQDQDTNQNHILLAGESLEGELTIKDQDGLLWMREEEKLARDLYLTLGDHWDLQIFNNIASSEVKHMDAVAELLEQFGLQDPVGELGVGQFSDPELQSLYDQLLKQGLQSVQEALLVGGAVEEIDILDLKGLLAVTEDESIRVVYENLLAGSENHLQSFSKVYSRQTGLVYEAQYMSSGELEQILDNEIAGSVRQGRSNGQRLGAK